MLDHSRTYPSPSPPCINTQAIADFQAIDVDGDKQLTWSEITDYFEEKEKLSASRSSSGGVEQELSSEMSKIVAEAAEDAVESRSSATSERERRVTVVAAAEDELARQRIEAAEAAAARKKKKAAAKAAAEQENAAAAKMDSRPLSSRLPAASGGGGGAPSESFVASSVESPSTATAALGQKAFAEFSEGFAALDDGSGIVSQTSFIKFMRNNRRRRASQVGVGTHVEGGMASIIAEFQSIDTNGDKALSWAEIDAHLKKAERARERAELRAAGAEVESASEDEADGGASAAPLSAEGARAAAAKRAVRPLRFQHDGVFYISTFVFLFPS